MDLGITELKERLLMIEEEAKLTFSEDSEFSCYIVGGGALILMGYIVRSTHDIDAISAYPDEIREVYEHYDMNTDCMVFISNFAEGYKDRAIRILPETTMVKFYVLSLEDIVISKLCSNGSDDRQKDIIDINSEKVINDLDWDRLAELAEIVESQQFSNIAREDFLWNYKDYVRRNKDA